jgi:hypothetical protein
VSGRPLACLAASARPIRRPSHERAARLTRSQSPKTRQARRRRGLLAATDPHIQFYITVESQGASQGQSGKPSLSGGGCCTPCEGECANGFCCSPGMRPYSENITGMTYAQSGTGERGCV